MENGRYDRAEFLFVSALAAMDGNRTRRQLEITC
jgi:hypothetical protein